MLFFMLQILAIASTLIQQAPCTLFAMLGSHNQEPAQRANERWRCTSGRGFAWNPGPPRTPLTGPRKMAGQTKAR